MHDAYINGQLATFTGDVMSVTFTHREKIAGLNPQPGRNYQWSYTLTYSPAAGSACNGVDARTIDAAGIAFVLKLTRGEKLATNYAANKKAAAGATARRMSSRSSDSVDRGGCTCGRCFDCTAQ